jgi:hypothetical protein
MAIVRELVTRLAFQVDRQGIQTFNQSLIGFKTRLTLAAGAIGGFAFSVLKTIRNVGDTILDTDILAKKSGIAFERLVALQKAASQFRISPQQFGGVIDEFADKIADAKMQIGDLANLAGQFQINFKDSQGQIKDTEKLLLEFLDKASKIQGERLRINAFAKIVGTELAGKFNEFFRGGAKAVDQLTTSLQNNAKGVGESVKQFQQFEKEVSQLESSFETFKQRAVINIAPAVTRGLSDVNSEIQRAERDFGPGIFSFLLGTLSSVVGNTARLISGIDPLEDAKEDAEFEQQQFERRLKERQAQGLSLTSREPITINNDIKIEVPPGTPEQQQKMIQDTAREAYSQMTEEMLREVINNNPQVE